MTRYLCRPCEHQWTGDLTDARCMFCGKLGERSIANLLLAVVPPSSHDRSCTTNFESEGL